MPIHHRNSAALAGSIGAGEGHLQAQGLGLSTQLEVTNRGTGPSGVSSLCRKHQQIQG